MNGYLTGSGVSRRDFLKTAAAASLTCAAYGSTGADKLDTQELHEARFWEPLDNKVVRCGMCPWGCIVPDGQRGRCRVRENRGGRYYSLVYGRPRVWHNDPIEKKPFFHVYPGSKAFSIATVGCNFACRFCQNWDISQANPEDVTVKFKSPDEIVQMALKQSEKPKTLAYTYNEPTIFAEYVIDCAKAAKEAGLGNIVVSNGFTAAKTAKELYPLVTAVKIDLKAFTDEFYTNICMGQLQPVLNTLKRLKGSNVWFEMVMLTIPTLNDNMDDIKRMAAWILKELGPNVPLHFTRFHPDYKLRNLPLTPMATLTSARKVAMEQGCNFVYTGNAPGEDGQSTFCPKCKSVVVDRYGYSSKTAGLDKSACGKCGEAIPGVWE